MDRKLLTRCPVCGTGKTEILLKLDCGNFDGSILYPSVKIAGCTRCGHIYNKVSSAEISNLMEYYNSEYAPTNIQAQNIISDKPGSNSPNSSRRYFYLYNFISPYVGKNHKILDCGCAVGGFLDYLSERGFDHLAGIDISSNYVNYAKSKSNYEVKLGSAESIPFKDKSFDVIVMDQIVEHLHDPRKSLSEARRVLTDNGLLCISVPDAAKYGKNYFSDFYWFVLREHLQHFDAAHLKTISESEGFKLISREAYNTPMTSEKAILPALSMLFRASDKNKKTVITKDYFGLKKKIKRYIFNDSKKLNKKIRSIKHLIVSQKPLYVWGLGREFLFLYHSAGLKKCNIAGLIDSNPHKQKNFSVDGRKINSKLILKNAGPGSAVLITAFGHSRPIKEEIAKMNYRGQVINIL